MAPLIHQIVARLQLRRAQEDALAHLGRALQRQAADAVGGPHAPQVRIAPRGLPGLIGARHRRQDIELGMSGAQLGLVLGRQVGGHAAAGPRGLAVSGAGLGRRLLGAGRRQSDACPRRRGAKGDMANPHPGCPRWSCASGPSVILGPGSALGMPRAPVTPASAPPAAADSRAPSASGPAHVRRARSRAGSARAGGR